MSERTAPKHRKLVIGIVGLGIVGLTLLVLAGMFIPAFIDKPSEKVKRLNCRAQLVTLGYAWQTYRESDPHFSHPPQSLHDFASMCGIGTKLEHCPSARGSQSYLYYGSFLNSSYAQLDRTVLISDLPDNHGDVIYMLMADGSTVLEADARTIEMACAKYGLILPAAPEQADRQRGHRGGTGAE